MIKNVIFDLGNVIYKLHWEMVILQFVKDSNDINLLMDAIFNSEEWLLLDEGTISKEEGIIRMKSKLPKHLHKKCDIIMTVWTDYLIINTPMVELVKELKSLGYKTYILSNAPHDIPKRLKSDRFYEIFDGQIISAEELIVKPNPDIYKLLLNRFSLKAEECLFIDDRKENIDAAINCGLHGLVYDYKKHDEFKDLFINTLNNCLK